MVDEKKCVEPDVDVLELVEYDGEGTEWELPKIFTEWDEMEEWIFNDYPVDSFSVDSILVRGYNKHSGTIVVLESYKITDIVNERYKREALNDGESEEFADSVGQLAVEEYNHRLEKKWIYRNSILPLYSEIVEQLK